MDSTVSPSPETKPDSKPETKPTVAIVVAIIGFIASIASAAITAYATAHSTAQKTAQTTAETTAQQTAKTTAQQTAATTAERTANAAIKAFQERVSGGSIDADMNKKDHLGRDFDVGKQGVGLFRITFKPPFMGDTVVAVAAPHKNPIPTLARIETHDGGSILVGIHRISDDRLVDAPFSFYVLEAVPVNP